MSSRSDSAQRTVKTSTGASGHRPQVASGESRPFAPIQSSCGRCQSLGISHSAPACFRADPYCLQPAFNCISHQHRTDTENSRHHYVSSRSFHVRRAACNTCGALFKYVHPPRPCPPRITKSSMNRFRDSIFPEITKFYRSTSFRHKPIIQPGDSSSVARINALGATGSVRCTRLPDGPANRGSGGSARQCSEVVPPWSVIDWPAGN